MSVLRHQSATVHHSRHLVHYQDDLADATCSLHCAALSLALNLDHGPKAIYAADFGAATTPKPLRGMSMRPPISLAQSCPGVMTKQSKVAFAAKAAAEAAKTNTGGELGNFAAAPASRLSEPGERYPDDPQEAL